MKSNLKVLVAEDDPAICRICTLALERRGFHVTVARDGEEGLRLFSESPDQFDIVLVDGVMPRLKGPEMIRQMFEIKPDAKILFMSGGSPDAFLPQELSRLSGLLPKPFTLNQLVETVEDIADDVTSPLVHWNPTVPRHQKAGTALA